MSDLGHGFFMIGSTWCTWCTFVLAKQVYQTAEWSAVALMVHKRLEGPTQNKIFSKTIGPQHIATGFSGFHRIWCVGNVESTIETQEKESPLRWFETTSSDTWPKRLLRKCRIFTFSSHVACAVLTKDLILIDLDTSFSSRYYAVPVFTSKVASTRRLHNSSDVGCKEMMSLQTLENDLAGCPPTASPLTPCPGCICSG